MRPLQFNNGLTGLWIEAASDSRLDTIDHAIRALRDEIDELDWNGCNSDSQRIALERLRDKQAAGINFEPRF